MDIDDNMDENDRDEVMTSAEALGGMSLNDTEQNVGNSANAPNGKISITYEKFEQIKLMLAHKLRLVQQSSDEGSLETKCFRDILLNISFFLPQILECVVVTW